MWYVEEGQAREEGEMLEKQKERKGKSKKRRADAGQIAVI